MSYTEGMTGEQLKVWRLRMRLKRYEAAAALGMQPDSYARLEKRADVGKRTALACAAISMGLPPAEG